MMRRFPKMQLMLPIVFLGYLSTTAAAAAPGDWERQWNNLIQAAKKDGKVVVAGSSDPVLRRDLPARFKARTGISVEYIGGRSSDIAARIRAEREGGVYSTDVIFSGIQAMASIFHPGKMLDPVRPVLILPEVLDGSKWKKGKLWFVDPEDRYILRLVNYLNELFYINTQHVKQAEFKSIKDLLDPKWKTKISAFDPTVPGSGSNTAAKLYAQFGEDFIKALYVDQKPAFSRDGRQLADWLARGFYPISFNAPGNQVEQLQQEGLPVKAIYHLPDAAGTTTAGSGMVGLMNKAPNPNAARVFINWIASKEGVEFLFQSMHWATARSDIDESLLKADETLRPGIAYFDSYDWNFAVNVEEKVRLRVKELLK